MFQLSVLYVLAAMTLINLVKPLAPHWDDMQLKHAWNAVPPGWEGLGPPPAGATIDLHIALNPHRKDASTEALYAISTPGSPNYGTHLSAEQVAKLVAPHPDTLRLVRSWLEARGVSSSTSMTHGGGWLTATGVPVSQADDLLGASYQVYRHTGTNKTILRTVRYALPAALHSHVQTVAPTTYFARPRTRQQTPRQWSRREATAVTNATSGELVTVLPSRDDDEDVEPDFLRTLYKTLTYVPAATDRNKIGITGQNKQYPRPEDLRDFLYDFRPDAMDATFEVELINGGENHPDQPGAEASTNLQYSVAMAYPTRHIFYSIGGVTAFLENNLPDPDDSDLVWLNHMLDLPAADIPQTVSISYGNEEWQVPPEYAAVICDLYKLLGLRGVSILVASGDDGVGLGDCKGESEEVLFMPTFPSNCPWVTSVGGTTLNDPEIGASLSGGGFSHYFLREEYQDDAVTDFLSKIGDDYAGLFNPHGRGIPDISAQALNFAVIIAGEPEYYDGTSCSSPTVAGIISLLNDFLIFNNMAPLGFLNPWLYGRGRDGLNDIILGNNPGCDTDGFFATEGWDPVTGLGTPDFIALQRVLPRLPLATPTPSVAP